MNKKSLGVGLALGMVIGGATIGYAVNTYVQAILNQEIKVSLNGQVQEFRDATTGEVMYPLTYKDRTYLPLRNVAETVGLDVDYDANTNTAILSNNIANSDVFVKDTVIRKEFNGGRSGGPASWHLLENGEYVFLEEIDAPKYNIPVKTYGTWYIQDDFLFLNQKVVEYYEGGEKKMYTHEDVIKADGDPDIVEGKEYIDGAKLVAKKEEKMYEYNIEYLNKVGIVDINQIEEFRYRFNDKIMYLSNEDNSHCLDTISKLKQVLDD